MRISVASLHPRALSGQIDSLAGLGRALTRRGHTVQLLAPFDSQDLLHRSAISLDAGPVPLPQAARRMLQTVPRIIQASKDADVLHLSLPTPAFAWLGDAVQRRIDVPLVVGFEGHLPPARVLLTPRRLRESWRTYLPLCLVNNGAAARLSRYSADRIVVSSQVQRSELVRLGADAARVAVLPNVVEADKLVQTSPSAARSELGLPADVPLIGYVGHFNDVKGVDVLAEAFARLSQQIPNVHLALAWSGQGKASRVTDHVGDAAGRIVWLNRVPVGTFLCAVDVLALPYRSTAGQGTFPSLVLEAVHLRTPLITSNLPLLTELLGPAGAALLTPPERPSELAAALERILTDDRARRSVKEGQRLLSQRYLLPDVLAEQYEALYASLVRVPARPLAATAIA